MFLIREKIKKGIKELGFGTEAIMSIEEKIDEIFDSESIPSVNIRDGGIDDVGFRVTEKFRERVGDILKLSDDPLGVLRDELVVTVTVTFYPSLFLEASCNIVDSFTEES